MSCTCISHSNTTLTPLLKSNQQSNNGFLSRENLNQLYHQLLHSINPLREPSKQLALTSRAFSLVVVGSGAGFCYSKVNQALRQVYKKKSLPSRYLFQLTAVLRVNSFLYKICANNASSSMVSICHFRGEFILKQSLPCCGQRAALLNTSTYTSSPFNSLRASGHRDILCLTGPRVCAMGLGSAKGLSFVPVSIEVSDALLL